MNIQRITAQGEEPLNLERVQAWAADRRPTMPFSPDAVTACAELSRALFADRMAKDRPDLIAFAYWLRRGSLDEMARGFSAGMPADCRAVPRGVALHFPPTNVDTVMAYCWALATLAGNRSLIRVSDRLGDSGRRLIELLFDILGASALAESTLFLRYPREDSITEVLSALADIRIMWGGDASVAKLRAITAPPRCRDVLFPDRRSLAALSLMAYQAAEVGERDRLAEALFVDALTFGQMACSSPRLLVWVGEGDVAAASVDFFARVAGVADRRDPGLPLGQVLAKRTQAAGAVLDGAATGWCDLGSAVTVLDWRDPAGQPADWSGGGLFLQAHVPALADIAPACDARTQTLTVHGFSRDEIGALVAAAGNLAPDRIVPFGRALAFAGVWDGLDLLREFTRLVHCPGG